MLLLLNYGTSVCGYVCGNAWINCITLVFKGYFAASLHIKIMKPSVLCCCCCCCFKLNFSELDTSWEFLQKMLFYMIWWSPPKGICLICLKWSFLIHTRLSYMPIQHTSVPLALKICTSTIHCEFYTLWLLQYFLKNNPATWKHTKLSVQ